jgi:hypothetical protein
MPQLRSFETLTLPTGNMVVLVDVPKSLENGNVVPPVEVTHGLASSTGAELTERSSKTRLPETPWALKVKAPSSPAASNREIP